MAAVTVRVLESLHHTSPAASLQRHTMLTVAYVLHDSRDHRAASVDAGGEDERPGCRGEMPPGRMSRARARRSQRESPRCRTPGPCAGSIRVREPGGSRLQHGGRACQCAYGSRPYVAFVRRVMDRPSSCTVVRLNDGRWPSCEPTGTLILPSTRRRALPCVPRRANTSSDCGRTTLSGRRHALSSTPAALFRGARHASCRMTRICTCPATPSPFYPAALVVRAPHFPPSAAVRRTPIWCEPSVSPLSQIKLAHLTGTASSTALLALRPPTDGKPRVRRTAAVFKSLSIH